MRKLKALLLLLLPLLLTACGGRATGVTSGGDTLSLNYARRLTMVDFPQYTVAELSNPWDTLRVLHTYILVDRNEPLPENLPKGTVVRVPLENALIYTSVHCTLVDEMGQLGRIGGICDLKYIQTASIRQACASGAIADCGDAMNPDIEKIIDLHPDALMLSPFENSGGYGRVEELGIPIIECADYMETSALGRAEWMKFYGRLFGAAVKADSMFAQVEEHYLSLKRQAGQSKISLSVIPDMKYGSTWYVPGGRSTQGGLYADAGARYPFADDEHSGSLALSFEAVFDRAGDSDVWIFRYNGERDMTLRQLRADFVGYTGLKALKTGQVYGCNTLSVPFYEEWPFHPDYLLSDYIQMVHPDISMPEGLRYYKKVEE